MTPKQSREQGAVLDANLDADFSAKHKGLHLKASLNRALSHTGPVYRRHFFWIQQKTENSAGT